MPLFEYTCLDCGQTTEVLLISSSDTPECGACHSTNLKKLMSAHASSSGPGHNHLPGAGDTACCGSAPGNAAGCAGPGSCCGKAF